MKKSVTIRYQQLGDAKRFYEILNSQNFTYFPAKPKTIKEERDFLRKNKEWREQKVWFNFTILYGDTIVGAVGVHRESHRPYCGEVGYFVDEEYWGKGIAVEAVKLIEKMAFEEFGITRIEINMIKANKASARVAEKSGYRKEGIAKGKLMLNGETCDCFVYGKAKNN
ncbi:Putative ribosomal N-acetyltransferase YdaF [Pontiella desulfatans]|uniref:Ribosomal N-acetyltransferase YdaF n=1 Tax=Pontiella desulfatans TaxID=2750659 RepID=A0A6C2UEF5_PONDE|nr:GNAT family N-acetyltransferase [Pontiella desulfatans]VGO17811.1 Putative ribosomal N-acetyltransferase YdaF [Pontiella desulfatans]